MSQNRRHNAQERERLARIAASKPNGVPIIAQQENVAARTVSDWLREFDLVPYGSMSRSSESDDAAAAEAATQFISTDFNDLFGGPVNVIDVRHMIEEHLFEMTWIADVDEAIDNVGDLNRVPSNISGFERDPSLFRSDDLYMTREVVMAAARNPEIFPWLQEIYQRHQTGDWGDLDKEDTYMNNISVRDGSRLVSSYDIPDSFTCKSDMLDSSVWIITDGGYSPQQMGRTTILFPTDY